MNDQTHSERVVSTAPEKASPHSVGNRVARVAWGVVCAVLFRPSPRPFHAWRRLLLSLFGASLHPSARVYPRARVWGPWNLTMGERATIADDVDVYCVRPLSIGARSTVSQYTYLCGATHDHRDPALPLVPMPVTIGSDVWVAADVFVAPGVTIGDGVVVGSRSSVFKDLPPWTVCMGTPAKPTGERILKGRNNTTGGTPVPRDASEGVA